MDRVLAAQPLKVPVMLVHSLWDQETSTAIAVQGDQAEGHGQRRCSWSGPRITPGDREGSALGAIRFGSDTALTFRREILRPFLDQYLKDGAARADVAPVMAFETGTNVWRRLPAWPAGCASGCSVKPTPLYLASGRKLDFAAPKSGDTAFDEYVSDPEKPVPFQARPILQSSYDDGKSWREWLVSDQREASGRPDVAVFVSDVLAAPVKISGQPVVNLVASTSGTDADWVVKVIDV